MKYLIIILVLLLSNAAFSDQFRLPFSCYPQELQAKFERAGYKLDLSANDRTRESWGFIQSEGASFSIFTYKSLQKEEMVAMHKILMED